MDLDKTIPATGPAPVNQQPQQPREPRQKSKPKSTPPNFIVVLCCVLCFGAGILLPNFFSQLRFQQTVPTKFTPVLEVENPNLVSDSQLKPDNRKEQQIAKMSSTEQT